MEECGITWPLETDTKLAFIDLRHPELNLFSNKSLLGQWAEDGSENRIYSGGRKVSDDFLLFCVSGIVVHCLGGSGFPFIRASSFE